VRIIRLNELGRDGIRELVRREVISEELIRKVEDVINCVRFRGDECLREFLRDFYGIEGDVDLRVTEGEFLKAYDLVSNSLVNALEVAIQNLREVQRSILPKELVINDLGGFYVGYLVRTVESVGIYVPGGKAPYPSTAIMTSVPAVVAGVPKVVVCTPPRGRDGSVDPAVLVALDLVGVREVYRLGGAHAVAAMAYGTESVPRVAKIVGPGGSWVTTAKYLVKGVVDIDMIAGPSEVVVLADESVNPKLVALDMVAQAEHDELATAALVTTSDSLAREVVKCIEEVINELPKDRGLTARKSLSSRGFVLVTNDLKEAIEFINEYAPEHLEVIVKPEDVPYVLSKLVNVGSVTIGELACTALSDYSLGTNHVLPTSGWARVRGGLSVYDFIKFVEVAYVSRDGLLKVGRVSELIANYEGFSGHALSIRERINSLVKLGGGRDG